MSYPKNAVLILIVALLALVCGRISSKVAPAVFAAPSPGGSLITSLPDPQQYPMADKIAAKIIDKYQSSTCEQLWQEKAAAQNKPKSVQEQEVIAALRNDPQMRAAFINKVAPPIVNKMFECGMVP